MQFLEELGISLYTIQTEIRGEMEKSPRALSKPVYPKQWHGELSSVAQGDFQVFKAYPFIHPHLATKEVILKIHLWESIKEYWGILRKAKIL